MLPHPALDVSAAPCPTPFEGRALTRSTPQRAGRSLTLPTGGRRREFATCESYSDWELNPVFGRLNLESPRGILDVSLSSDGLRKSDGNREREAERGVLCFQNKLATVSRRPMVPGGENPQNGATDARIGGNARPSVDRENGASAFRSPMNGGGNCTHEQTLSECGRGGGVCG